MGERENRPRAERFRALERSGVEILDQDHVVEYSALHDDGRFENTRTQALMGKNRSAIYIQFILDVHVVSEDGCTFNSRPASHRRAPADNRRLDEAVVLGTGAVEENAALEAGALSDDAVRADYDVRADARRRVDLGSRVDKHVARDDGVVLGRVGEVGRLARGEVREVEASSGEVILRLANVHPEALEVHRVQLLVAGHGREDLGLDRSRLDLDTVEDRRVEDVDAGVDAVANVLFRLLDKAVDGALARVGQDDAVLGRLVDLGDHDGALAAVRDVEVAELVEGVRAGDVRVEDKERRLVLAEDFASEGKRTSRAEGLGLDREGDGDLFRFAPVSITR